MNLATGRDHTQYRTVLPITGEEVTVTLSREDGRITRRSQFCLHPSAKNDDVVLRELLRSGEGRIGRIARFENMRAIHRKSHAYIHMERPAAAAGGRRSGHPGGGHGTRGHPLATTGGKTKRRPERESKIGIAPAPLRRSCVPSTITSLVAGQRPDARNVLARPLIPSGETPRDADEESPAWKRGGTFSCDTRRGPSGFSVLLGWPPAPRSRRGAARAWSMEARLTAPCLEHN